MSSFKKGTTSGKSSRQAYEDEEAFSQKLRFIVWEIIGIVVSAFILNILK